MGYGNNSEFEKFSKKGKSKFDDERNGKNKKSKPKDKWSAVKGKRGSKQQFCDE